MTNTSKVGQRHSSRKRKVFIIGAGGTALGDARSAQQMTRYAAASYHVRALVDKVPGINDDVDLELYTFEPFKDSIDNTTHGLLKLRDLVSSKLTDPEVEGGVIVHGTDTTEETAWFLQLTIKSDKPVVLMGATLPLSAIGTDGPLGFYLSVLLVCSAQARGRGIMVLSAGQILPAHSAGKTDCNFVRAFDAPNSGPLGRFVGDQPIFNYPPFLPVPHPFLDISKLVPAELPKVSILMGHPEAEPGLFNCAIDLGAKGIVLAALGSGYWPKEALAKMRTRDVIVVVSGQTATGYNESDGIHFGIPAGFLSARKARILLILCLWLGLDRDAIKNVFSSGGFIMRGKL